MSSIVTFLNAIALLTIPTSNKILLNNDIEILSDEFESCVVDNDILFTSRQVGKGETNEISHSMKITNLDNHLENFGISYN